MSSLPPYSILNCPNRDTSHVRSSADDSGLSDCVMLEYRQLMYLEQHMRLERKDLLRLAKQVLTELGISTAYGLEVTYMIKTQSEWRVNFSFKRSYGVFPERGCFSVDIDTGDITFAALRREWQ